MSDDPTRKEKVDAKEAQEARGLLRERRTKKAGDPETLRLAETPVPGRALTAGRSNGDWGAVACRGMPEGVEDRDALDQVGEGRTCNPAAPAAGCATLPQTLV